MSGTAIAYGALRYARCGTDIVYGATPYAISGTGRSRISFYNVVYVPALTDLYNAATTRAGYNSRRPLLLRPKRASKRSSGTGLRVASYSSCCTGSDHPTRSLVVFVVYWLRSHVVVLIFFDTTRNQHLGSVIATERTAATKAETKVLKPLPAYAYPPSTD
eukprot:2210455-Rhodomonas_salina.1